MRVYVRGAALVLSVATSAVRASEPGVPDRHPVYVGVKVCSECHSGPESGHLFSRWRASKHAGAYASLWSPEARKIAELSGIPQEPRKAAACLGCHVAGYDAEAWEKEDTFHPEDGIQCESCHGPGSDYKGMKIMKDRDASVAAGLLLPDESTCKSCHEGAPHEQKAFDYASSKEKGIHAHKEAKTE